MTTSLAGKKAWILGADPSAEAAAELARRRGAACRQFSGEETLDTSETLPDVAVVSAGFGRTPPLARALQERGVNVIGERELAFQESLCLHVAIAGANGKSTTAELVAHVLRESGRRVAVACGPEHPASAFVEMTRDLDLMVHGVEAGELEHLKFFRPVVAVLLNAPLDGAEENDGGGGERAAAPARNWGLYGPLFASQQAFDWAIVQSEALALFQAAGARLPGKVITFSAFSRQADLGYDRGLLVSRLEAWSGRLWDTGNGRMRGPHLAENALAALAVGRVLRISLDEMRHALESFEPGPGRFETIGEAEGVRFIDDGRSANSDALAKALLALAPAPPERPFIWLVGAGAAVL